MTLLGGGVGGAGNPVGGSFTGPAEALEIVLDRVYAYSGLVTIAAGGSADHTMLKFTTGNYVCKAFIEWHSEATGTEDEFVSMFMNGQEVMHTRYSHAYHSSADQGTKLIIPSYTEVECKFGNASGTDATMILTGKRYREPR